MADPFWAAASLGTLGVLVLLLIVMIVDDLQSVIDRGRV